MVSTVVGSAQEYHLCHPDNQLLVGAAAKALLELQVPV